MVGGLGLRGLGSLTFMIPCMPLMLHEVKTGNGPLGACIMPPAGGCIVPPGGGCIVPPGGGCIVPPGGGCIVPPGGGCNPVLTGGFAPGAIGCVWLMTFETGKQANIAA